MRLVYLHGFASSPASKKAAFFRDKFRALGIAMHVPDLSQGDFEHLTITGQLEVVAREHPTVLIGSSMGGYLAALHASRNPQVEKVVLLAPAFGFTKRWPNALGPDKTEEWRRTGWTPFFHYADQKERLVHYGLVEDGARYEDFPELRQPTLVFHGLLDNVVPCDLSLEFGKRTPSARVEILDSDHELVNVLDYMWGETERFLRIDSPAR
jgi:uncharacterized protein